MVVPYNLNNIANKDAKESESIRKWDGEVSMDWTRWNEENKNNILQAQMNLATDCVCKRYCFDEWPCVHCILDVVNLYIATELYLCSSGF